MGRCGWILALVILAATAQMHPAVAQGRSDGFSDAFFNDIVTPAAMTGLWNRAFARCQAAGQRPLEDCVIRRATSVVAHGRLTGPRCAHVSYDIARHYCIVIGSIAADLMVKFELKSAEGFIKVHGADFEVAVDSAGTE